MTVHVVTDSTACLPPALADEYGITVLDIHTRGQIPTKGADAPGVPEDIADDEAGGKDADTDAAPEDAGSVGESGDTDDADDPGDVAGDSGTGDSGKQEEDAPTTAGLGPLELTAAYARLLERGGDEGVVALHLSRELSSTWTSATQAAGVFHGLVEVLDTRSAGMVLGQAAIAAAQASAAGGTLAECTAAAQHVLDGAEVWLYVHRLDAMARGGRLSTAQRLLSTALAIKPILHLAGGKIELAAKTRTQSKAMARLVSLAESAYRTAATPARAPETDEDAADAEDAVGTQDSADSEDTPPETGDAVESVEDTQAAEATEVTEAADTEAPQAETDDDASDDGADSADDADTSGEVEQQQEEGRPRVFTFGGDHEFRLRKRKEAPVPLSELPAVPMHLDIHQAGCPEIAEELRATLRADLPDCVVISVVDLSPALMVHTGPEAIGITLVQG
ncbi:DegV family protein [Corynebacterium variabile]|uniref:DegV family protein n=2 Tax=Corynebacterium variabile TaxID=1727 RepID=UPI0025946765|nr:DegV family protein [Corynebacterium variabile]MDN6240847.1 DegV family protein [Corynebacterium variabile]MDN6677627.1 DegV family protein [Corynebacterium variabile]MDN6814270.1 DegV family protein [Corynebacterium variabile]MDN6843858.1 DegV family protein [Corynebacterium variabile]